MTELCKVDWAALAAWAQAATVVATIPLLMAMKNAANRQAEAAQAATRVADQQRIAAEEAVAAARTQNKFALLQAQAAARPLLVVIAVEDHARSQIVYFVENQGAGAAHSIHWWPGTELKAPAGKARFIETNTLGSGYRARIDCDTEHLRKSGMVVECYGDDRTNFINLIQPVDGQVFQQHLEFSTTQGAGG
jgi:hypothetical protein